jgi:hypothetical protein
MTAHTQRTFYHYGFILVVATIVLTIAWSLFPHRSQYALPSVCPKASDLQSDYVKSHFDPTKLQGMYYELAMKDVTQPRMCSCQTANKTYVSETRVHDDFSIQCYDAVYHADLSFATHSDVRGVSIGTWNGMPLIDQIEFRNTVVDVGVNAETGEYDWVIEFQCVPGMRFFSRDWIAFYAFNFYSKDYRNQEGRIAHMAQVFRARGLGAFLDHGAPMAIIDHSDCIENH